MLRCARSETRLCRRNSLLNRCSHSGSHSGSQNGARNVPRDLLGIPFHAAEIGLENADAAADEGAEGRARIDLVPGVHHAAEHLGVALDRLVDFLVMQKGCNRGLHARAAVDVFLDPGKAVEQLALDAEAGQDIVAHDAADPETQAVTGNAVGRIAYRHRRTARKYGACLDAGLRIVDEHEGNVGAYIPLALVPLCRLRAGLKGPRNAQRQSRRSHPAGGAIRQCIRFHNPSCGLSGPK